VEVLGSSYICIEPKLPVIVCDPAVLMYVFRKLKRYLYSLKPPTRNWDGIS